MQGPTLLGRFRTHERATEFVAGDSRVIVEARQLPGNIVVFYREGPANGPPRNPMQLPPGDDA